jgi:hypothetical protein
VVGLQSFLDQRFLGRRGDAEAVVQRLQRTTNRCPGGAWSGGLCEPWPARTAI